MSNKLTLGYHINVEIAKTYAAAPKALGGIEAAVDPIVTCVGHGFTAGAVIVLSVPTGMVELNNRACVVGEVIDADSFTLATVDTRGLDAFTTGSATLVTAWDKATTVTSFDCPRVAPAQVGITALNDAQQVSMLGKAGQRVATMNAHFSAEDAFLKAFRNASDSLDPRRAMRVRFLATGAVIVFNADVDGGDGVSITAGDNVASTTLTASVVGAVSTLAAADIVADSED